jgi:peptide/nickel transport system substrate-binding protein
VVGIGALLFALAACTGSGKGSGTNSSTNAPAPSVAKIVLSAPLGSFDPNQLQLSDQLAVTHLLGGNLTAISAYTGPASKPSLAQDISVSSDQLTYTFTLRPNLKFSDGTALTSADVKADFGYWMGDKASVVAGLVAPISAVTATSPTVVTVQLKSPDPALEDVLSEPNFMIFPASGLQNKATFFKKPISAGQYMYSDISSDGTTSTMVANPNYWGPKPAIQTLQVTTATDESTRLAQIQSGQADLAWSITPSDARAVQKPAFAQFTPLYGQLAVTMNVNDSILKDPRIRNALSLATDRTALRNLVWGTNANEIKPLGGFFPSSDPGYNVNDSVKQDIAGAKALLKGTACENGCTLHYKYHTGQATNEPVGTVLKQQWQAIGVNLVLEPGERSAVNKDLNAGIFQLGKGSFYDYIGNPSGMMTLMLQSDGGPFADFSRYSSPQMDQLIKSYLAASPADQPGILNQVDQLFMTDRPLLILTDYADVTVQRISASIMRESPAGLLDVASAS